jgi:6-phosphogluconolactonase
VSDPVVRRHASAQLLAEDVAAELIAFLAEVQSRGRVPAVALTGGTIAGRVHAAVAGSPYSARVEWDRVELWFGDERYVPADDPERNALQARQALLDVVPVDAARVHEMPASDAGHATVADAASAYAEELRASGSGMFDLVMLGVGPDGHVASLFPGFPQLDADDIAVGVTGSPKPPPERISLTFPALNRSREVWFMVAGTEKAAAVAAALSVDEAPDVHDLPAAGVHGAERTVWFLDEDAASALPS